MKTALIVFQRLRDKVQSLSTLLRFDQFAKSTGRKLAITITDIITIGLFKQHAQIQTKKKVYELLELDTHCTYKTMVVNMNRFAALAAKAIAAILWFNRQQTHPIKHTDSTAIPVCLNKNVRYHKTMQGLAQWGHDGKGFYYGLKLHLTDDLNRSVLAVKFTSAAVGDREMLIPLNKNLTGLFVADAGYISSKLEHAFFQEGVRRVLIASKKNMKKLATFFDIAVYRTRMLIEQHFRNLKLFYGLVTSMPRSVDGYLANYTYALLAYLIA